MRAGESCCPVGGGALCPPACCCRAWFVATAQCGQILAGRQVRRPAGPAPNLPCYLHCPHCLANFFLTRRLNPGSAVGVVGLGVPRVRRGVEGPLLVEFWWSAMASISGKSSNLPKRSRSPGLLSRRLQSPSCHTTMKLSLGLT